MHTTYLLKRYALVAGLTMVGLGLLSVVLSMMAGVELGGALGIVSAIGPALGAGQTYGQRWEKRPDSGYAWKLSVAFVVLNFVVSIVLVVILTAATSELSLLGTIIAGVGPLIFGAIMLVIFAVYLCATRYFFGYGAKLAVRALRDPTGTNQP